MTDIIPFSDEQAKALQEGFKFGTAIVEVASGTGRYIANVLGTTPADVVGLMGGDYLRIKRFERCERLAQRAAERLHRNGIELNAASPAIALPLFEAAKDETREELISLWAELLAASMDPARANGVRQAYIDAIKKMDPSDALILKYVPPENFQYMMGVPNYFAQKLNIGSDEAEVSLFHLMELGFIRDLHARAGMTIVSFERPILTAFGRQFLRILGQS